MLAHRALISPPLGRNDDSFQSAPSLRRNIATERRTKRTSSAESLDSQSIDPKGKSQRNRQILQKKASYPLDGGWPRLTAVQDFPPGWAHEPSFGSWTADAHRVRHSRLNWYSASLPFASRLTH